MRAPYVLVLTDEQRSMIASAYVNTRRAPRRSIAGPESLSLCCARDAVQACAVIVGERFAHALRNLCYDYLSCTAYHDVEADASLQQEMLDRISGLEELEEFVQ